MDGIIIVDKPQNYTSHDVVRKVKKIFNEKVGHTGTLDPMATGVLPLLIGKGTLCSKYLINHDKTYQVVLQLGKKTDTGDGEGKIVEEKEIEDIKEEKVKEILKSFLGQQKQTPPIYSAIKVNGKKLYEYARKGQTVEIPTRMIIIYSICNIEVDSINKEIKFEVSCSKGTYIRTLCEDIANKLNTVGYMKSLRRIKVGDFDISNAINISELEKIADNIDILNRYFIPVEKLFKDREKILIDSRKLTLFLNGVKLKCDNKDNLYRIYDKEAFIGTGIVNNGTLKRDIIINL